MSGLDGERGRNRTFNLLIKSQLLCQLSYAPFAFGVEKRGFQRRHYQCNTGQMDLGIRAKRAAACLPGSTTWLSLVRTQGILRERKIHIFFIML